MGAVESMTIPYPLKLRSDAKKEIAGAPSGAPADIPSETFAAGDAVPRPLGP